MKAHDSLFWLFAGVICSVSVCQAKRKTVYTLVTNKQYTWNEAYEICRVNFGGTILKIPDRRTALLITEYRNTVASWNGLSEYWTGLHHPFVDGQVSFDHYWADCSQWQDTSWSNWDIYSMNNEQMSCVLGKLGNQQWAHTSCINSKFVICQHKEERCDWVTYGKTTFSSTVPAEFIKRWPVWTECSTFCLYQYADGSHCWGHALNPKTGECITYVAIDPPEAHYLVSAADWQLDLRVCSEARVATGLSFNPQIRELYPQTDCLYIDAPEGVTGSSTGTNGPVGHRGTSRMTPSMSLSPRSRSRDPTVDDVSTKPTTSLSSVSTPGASVTLSTIHGTSSLSRTLSTVDTSTKDASTTLSTVDISTKDASTILSTVDTSTKDVSTTMSTVDTSAKDAFTTLSTVDTSAKDASTTLSTVDTSAKDASTTLSTVHTSTKDASTTLSTVDTSAKDASTTLSTVDTSTKDASTTLSTVHTSTKDAFTTLSTVHTSTKDAFTTLSTFHTSTKDAFTTLSTVDTSTTDAFTTLSTVHTSAKDVSTTLSTVDTSTKDASASPSTIGTTFLTLEANISINNCSGCELSSACRRRPLQQGSNTKLIAEILQNLTRTSASFSSYRRRFVSADDVRMSAKVCGLGAMVVLILMYASLILSDISKVIRDFQHTRSSVRDVRV